MPGCLGQESPRQTKPKKGQFMNFSRGHSGTKVQCESRLFSQGKAPEFTTMDEIHELFVLALSLVWFAGATHDWGGGLWLEVSSPFYATQLGAERLGCRLLLTFRRPPTCPKAVGIFVTHLSKRAQPVRGRERPHLKSPLGTKTFPNELRKQFR